LTHRSGEKLLRTTQETRQTRPTIKLIELLARKRAEKTEKTEKLHETAPSGVEKKTISADSSSENTTSFG
jgi:hypothetical protein